MKFCVLGKSELKIVFFCTIFISYNNEFNLFFQFFTRVGGKEKVHLLLLKIICRSFRNLRNNFSHIEHRLTTRIEWSFFSADFRNNLTPECWQYWHLPWAACLSLTKCLQESSTEKQIWGSNSGYHFIFHLGESLGVGNTFRLLMQSWHLFFSRPFNENYKILKNCPYNFHKILHSHFTPKGAPACAMALKSYDWDVRNIVKSSPKMTKKQPLLNFFHFPKNCTYDSNEILYSHSTPY